MPREEGVGLWLLVLEGRMYAGPTTIGAATKSVRDSSGRPTDDLVPLWDVRGDPGLPRLEHLQVGILPRPITCSWVSPHNRGLLRSVAPDTLTSPLCLFHPPTRRCVSRRLFGTLHLGSRTPTCETLRLAGPTSWQ